MPRVKELKLEDHKGNRVGGYVIVSVDYLEEVTEGWIFGGEIPQGLSLTEDGESEYEEFGCVLHRKWAGPMTHDAIQKLRYEWDMRHEGSEPNLGMLTEYGFLPGDRFDFTGDEWNQGGWTPIFDVSVSIFDAEAVQDADFRRS